MLLLFLLEAAVSHLQDRAEENRAGTSPQDVEYAKILLCVQVFAAQKVGILHRDA